MSETIFGNWKRFKNDKEYLLFHLKSSFRSQDIYFFVLTFWSCRKTARLERLFMVNFNIYDITTWLTNNCNTHIAQYLKK